ncbi:MAG: trypsin-like peptidase domain-containing protein, partial [Lachnospiraceae bacterium]|nr:trypsin-like peptidase domain-containing protein [Lachnospiraceae bacterium]
KGRYYSEYDTYRYRTPEGYQDVPGGMRPEEGVRTGKEGRDDSRHSGLVAFFAVIGVAAVIVAAGLLVYSAVSGKSVGRTIYGILGDGRNVQPEAGASFENRNDSEAPEEVISESMVEGRAESAGAAAFASENLTIPEIVKKVMPSMVSIADMPGSRTEDGAGDDGQTAGKSVGSGIIVGKDGEKFLIATNSHVIPEASEITVTFVDDSSAAAELVTRDDENDLAILGIRIRSLTEETQKAVKVVDIGDSDSVEVGESVVAIGNALGYGQSVSAGIISASGCVMEDNNGNLHTLFQTDASINPGNSGGALLNMRGELIGINEAKYVSTRVEGVGYAIPMAFAISALEKEGVSIVRRKVSDENASYIGITCVSVPAEYIKNGYPEGVYVLEVEEGGPAAAVGIQAGDIILTLEGTPVPTQEALIDELSYYAAGEKVSITVSSMNRNTGAFETADLVITLGKRADMKAASPDAEAKSGESESAGSDSVTESTDTGSDTSEEEPKGIPGADYSGRK